MHDNETALKENQYVLIKSRVYHETTRETTGAA